jgi:glutamate transport system permease protein
MIALMKNTTIAAGFSVLEAGALQPYLSERSQNQTYVLLWITIFFLILILPLISVQRVLERRWRVAR